MKVGILKERTEGELRVAASPETVKKMAALKLDVLVEKSAGNGSLMSDDAYAAAGATLTDAKTILEQADIVLKVQPPFEALEDGTEEVSLIKSNAVFIGLVNGFENRAKLEKFYSNNISSLGMEFVPRITRAQSMDVLSSQSNLAGYRAVVEAANYSAKVMPMMMTAAGTISPAKVLVLGAGVAGLQAIATAKRLGAVVSAFDVRPAVKEQVMSLGAKFVEVPADDANAETAGGYAKEMSEEYKRKQSQLIHDTIIQQDIVITTALIPGKPAPKLITADMVNAMKKGAVIMDLAAPAGGNCELCQKDKVVNHNGVTIVGTVNLVSHTASDASALYARNVLSLLQLLVKDGVMNLNLEDEVIKGMLVTHQGKIMHPMLQPVAPEVDKKPVPIQAVPKKMAERKPHLKKTTKSAKGPSLKEGSVIEGED